MSRHKNTLEERDVAMKAAFELAKTEYFNYQQVPVIAKKTGLDPDALRRRIYGQKGGPRNPEQDSWYYERELVHDNEVAEFQSRNRYLAQRFTATAMVESYESLIALRDRLDAKGKKVPLKPNEIKALNETVVILDRLMRLSQGSPTEIVDLHVEGAPVNQDGNIILDMKKVAEALVHDSAMQKLLKGAMDDQGPKDITPRGGASRTEGSNTDGPAISNESRGTEQASHERIQRGNQVVEGNPNKGPEYVGSFVGRSSNKGPDIQDRDTRSDDNSPEERELRGTETGNRAEWSEAPEYFSDEFE